MLSLKQLRVIQGTAAAAVMLALVGCQSEGHGGRSPDERSEGRQIDDKQITENVEKGLQNEPVYKFSSVSAKTFGGVVQLGGFVNSDDQKRRAEEIAESIPGVRKVENGIAIKPEMELAPTGLTTNNAPRIYSQ